MARELTIRINEHEIARLTDADDIWTLEYCDAWRGAADGFDLSPALPRTQAIHRDGATSRPVQWYFDNLLPEEALRTMLAKEAKLPAEDAFGLLAYYGAESAGALVLHAPEASAPAPQGLQPLPLATLSARIANLPKVSLTNDAPKHMSLAGAQHKLLVVQQDGNLYEPLAGTSSTHILKPYHPDDSYPASVMNEFFAMRLADAVGLNVPKVQRLYVPQPVYLVERFDRFPIGDGNAVGRRHVVDTCQLLNKSRTFKYTAANLDSLAAAVEQCRAKAAARVRLYRWLVFNLLAGNGDNHLKNISFLVDGAGIELAPPYDLLCTAVYETAAMGSSESRWPHTSLALAIGDAKTFAEVTREQVVAAGRMLKLSADTALRELDRMVRAMPVAADALLAEIEAGVARDVAASPDPEATQAHVAGELRLLRAARHIVIADMVRALG